MLDEKAIRLKIENMERAAEEALLQNAAFFEALHMLKLEIERDPQVQCAVNKLQIPASTVSSSFVPHVQILIKTSKGEIALPRRREGPRAAGQATQLTLELRQAASSAIRRNPYREELESIVNEALETSCPFERMASEIESAGHEVVICLDLAACAQFAEPSEVSSRLTEANSITDYADPLRRLLSDRDLDFLNSLKIKVSET